MTREEAKAWLEHHFDPIPDGTKQSEAVSLAIKALEQEPILDKIRAEIDDATEIHSDGEFYIKNIDVKRIIDKYETESEDKE